MYVDKYEIDEYGVLAYLFVVLKLCRASKECRNYGKTLINFCFATFLALKCFHLLAEVVPNFFVHP